MLLAPSIAAWALAVPILAPAFIVSAWELFIPVGLAMGLVAFSIARLNRGLPRRDRAITAQT